ncbi:MAG: FISUMP domain-containing protein [Methanosarcinaceae archaeon]
MFACERLEELEGYKLSEHAIVTSEPCNVNIMFTVSDMHRKGVSTLTLSDFLVEEDRRVLSSSESCMILRKREEASDKMKTVLLLDNSASIGNNLDDIKEAAKAVINKIMPNQEIAIYVLSMYSTLIQDFTSDVGTLTDAINGITISKEATDIYGGVISGILKWEDNYLPHRIEEGFMILITDGGDTYGTITMDHITASIRDRMIYTIGIGVDQDREALKELGRSGYFSLADYTELADKMSSIQDEMISYVNSFYCLSYMSEKRGGSHTLKLSINNNSNGNHKFEINGSFKSSSFYSAQQGVTINNGIGKLDLCKGGSAQIDAMTHFPEYIPDYEWSTSDRGIVSLVSINDDNSSAIISAVGDEGQSASISVFDRANSLSDTITVQIISNPYGQFTDSRDGQIYQTIQIGEQIWMAENLNYDAENGSCVYGNNPSNADIYGRLYTWEAAMQVCPPSWHLPSDNEWKELEMYLGMSKSEADAIYSRGTDQAPKFKSTEGWLSIWPAVPATNESGFSAIPGGKRDRNNIYQARGENAYFWTSTAPVGHKPWYRQIGDWPGKVWREQSSKSNSYSVRCVKNVK